jgi:hypothetical protein
VLQIPFATANEEPSNDGRSKEQRARRHAVATVHARTP